MENLTSAGNNPIAVFDSGVGGISVLKELIKLLPNEDFIYFGDSANAPYGTKSLEEVRRFTEDNVRDLIEEGCKALLIACNTATSASSKRLRERYPFLPIVGLEPAIKPACAFRDHPTVLVLATPITVHEEKFRALMKRFEDKANIIPVPCPGLMDFVERGELEGERLEAYLCDLFLPYAAMKPDAVVLGCTHYPFIVGPIARVAGKGVRIFDGSCGAAKRMKDLLEKGSLLNPQTETGKVEIRNSAKGKGKEELCARLLEM